MSERNEKNTEKRTGNDPLQEQIILPKSASPDTIRILLIAPYANLIHVFDDALYDRPNMLLTSLESDSVQIREMIRTIAIDQYDVIISRGKTAEVLQSLIPNQRILDVGVSLYDVLRTLRRASGHNEKSCLIGFHNISHYAALMRGYFNETLDIFTVSGPEDLPRRLNEIRNAGYTLVLGDLMSYNYARLMGMRSILIETGEETVNRLLDFVEDFFTASRNLLLQNRFFLDLIHTAVSPLAVCDHTGSMIYRSESFTPEMENLLRDMTPLVTENGEAKRTTMVDGKPFHISGKLLCSDNYPDCSLFSIRAIAPEQYVPEPGKKNTPEISLEGSLHDITRRIILEVLKEERGNQAAASRRLNISRTTLRKYIEEYESET